MPCVSGVKWESDLGLECYCQVCAGGCSFSPAPGRVGAGEGSPSLLTFRGGRRQWGLGTTNGFGCGSRSWWEVAELNFLLCDGNCEGSHGKSCTERCTKKSYFLLWAGEQLASAVSTLVPMHPALGARSTLPGSGYFCFPFETSRLLVSCVPLSVERSTLDII